MKLEEILKEAGLSEEQIGKVLSQMKENKIHLAAQENLDIRYEKLKSKFTELVAKEKETTKLIKELKESSNGHEGIEEKLKEYESTIEKKTAELEKLKTETALKLALVGGNAVDADYLMYKLKEEEITRDETGKIKDIDKILEDLKTKYPLQFTDEAGKKYKENKLKDNIDDNNTEPTSLAEALKQKYEEGKER